ncbi:MAG: hypothetical protein KF830_03795 [Planctomycetes bacterium]|nr:hypothetical protein [Planctomycetota bacterium]
MSLGGALALALTTFGLGGGLGGVGGWWVGRGAQATAVVEPAAEPPCRSEPAADEDLRELHRCAGGPLEPLLARRAAFLRATYLEYPDDPILWAGCERIAVALLDGHRVPDLRLFATFFAQVLERSTCQHAVRLQHYAPRLRQLQ